MKYLRLFESNDNDIWENIQGQFDVFQLIELLEFKYGKIFPNTQESIKEEEENDYNTDLIYEVIEYELKSNNKWEDFITNYKSYEIEKDEADPFHWRNRAKAYDNLKNSIKWDESVNNEDKVTFKSKRNNLEFYVYKSGGKITRIENKTGIRFPYSIGQTFTRNIETWACNNNILIDGKDTCPEQKIFGVRVSDVPKGHEWRQIFPNKFK